MSRRGPRVLLVTAEYAPTPGGLGDYTARLAEALQAAGAEPAVLTGRQRPDTPLSASTMSLQQRPAPLNPPNPGGTRPESLPARVESPPELGGWGGEIPSG